MGHTRGAAGLTTRPRRLSKSANWTLPREFISRSTPFTSHCWPALITSFCLQKKRQRQPMRKFSGAVSCRSIAIPCAVGISSSDDEHTAALERAMAIRDELSKRGWPEPIFADSGNGGHLLYQVDLPRDDGGLVERP